MKQYGVKLILICTLGLNIGVPNFGYTQDDKGDGAVALFERAFSDLSKAKTQGRKKNARMFLSINASLTLIFPNDRANAKKIAAYIEKAANINVSCAQFALAEYYYNGVRIFDDKEKSDVEIFPMDKEKSFIWVKRSAENGCPGGQEDLGLAYAQGDGVLENDRLAAKWGEKAAFNGRITAMMRTSANYGAGKGVNRDKVKALAWILVAESEISKTNSDKVGLTEKLLALVPEMKEDFKSHLTQAQVEKGQDMAIDLSRRVEKNRSNFGG
jgi:TPR repeat protein